jgi:hypothetical protein
MRAQPIRNSAYVPGLILGLAMVCLAGDDLTLTKKITVGGNDITAQTLIKGARERTTMDMGGGAAMCTIRQCDLKRSLTVNDAQKAYLVKRDVDEADNSRAAAAALMGAAPVADSGGTLTFTSTIKDTGERKQMFGHAAKHLKISVLAQSSPNACNAVKQKYEIDGWYIDVKEQEGCQRFSPYMKDVPGCHDHVVLKQMGTVKPGLAVKETVTITNGDDQPMVVATEVTEMKQTTLAPELFEMPADYKEVSSSAELYGAPAMSQMAQAGTGAQPNSYSQPQNNPAQNNQIQNKPSMAQMMNPASAIAMQQQAMAQAQMSRMSPGNSSMNGMQGMQGMQGMGGPQGGAPVAAPQALGPKVAGKIRIGVAPPETQLGQGNNAGADYSTPVRNAIVALMSGPAVEIAALDSHVPIQLQAEAQQKQCDFVLYSSIAVKHSSGGGFGKMMKMAGPMSSMIPLAGMGGGMGGAVAAQAAGAAASAAAMSAQQQAMSQLAGFNGQIKSKDDVNVQYQLTATGQTTPQLQNALSGKAKSDGEDVLTPLLTQVSNAVLTEATKKP